MIHHENSFQCGSPAKEKSIFLLLSKGAFVDSGKESSRFWRRIGLVHYAYQEVEGRSSVCVST